MSTLENVGSRGDRTIDVVRIKHPDRPVWLLAKAPAKMVGTSLTRTQAVTLADALLEAAGHTLRVDRELKSRIDFLEQSIVDAGGLVEEDLVSLPAPLPRYVVIKGTFTHQDRIVDIKKFRFAQDVLSNEDVARVLNEQEESA